jgi:CRP-like cAMP-binding protein
LVTTHACGLPAATLPWHDPHMGIRAVFVNAREQREAKAGETVFAEGDRGPEMFGVISGSIELRKGDRILTGLGEGDTFGEMAIISDAPRSLSAVATEDSVLAVIDEKTFLYLVHETPMFAIQVMRSMADRIRELDEQG